MSPICRVVFLFSLIFVANCGRTAKHVESSPWTSALKAERTRLRGVIMAETADHIGHWPSDADCDAELWAGEARSAGLEGVDMSLGMTADGRPTRKPLKDCGPDTNDSQATTSTDMQLGLIEGLVAANDLNSLKKLESYVRGTDGWAGFPADASHIALTYMKPGTRTLLALAIRHLGGKPEGEWVYVPIAHGVAGVDFETHILLVSLAVERDVGIWAQATELSAQSACTRNPTDAMALAICGQSALAAQLVLAPGWSPPSYVRGSPAYAAVHKLWIVNYLLR